MKKLYNKAFVFLMLGIGLFLLVRIIQTIIAWVVGPDLSALEGMFTKETLESAASMTKVFMVVLLIGTLLLYSYFIFRLINNRKESAPQGYLSVLFVFNFIGILGNLISLTALDYLALVGLAINALIIVGLVMQKSYNPPPPEEAPQPISRPATIDPYIVESYKPENKDSDNNN